MAPGDGSPPPLAHRMAHCMILTVLLGKAGGLQESDLTLRVQVLLVTTEDDYDVGTGQCAGVRQPGSQ